MVFPKQICKRILPDTGESRSDKTFFLKTNTVEMVARVFMHCPLDSRPSLNYDSLWFPPLFYSFFDLSAGGELTRHRATSASNHAQPNQGTAKIRGTGSALSRPAPACPRTTWLIKRRQRSFRRRRLHCRRQATINKSFLGPQYIVWTRKKEKAKGPNPFFCIPSSLLVPSSTFINTFFCDGLGCVSTSLAQKCIFSFFLPRRSFVRLFVFLLCFFFSPSLVFHPVLSFFRPDRSFVLLFLFLQEVWTRSDSNVHTCLEFWRWIEGRKAERRRRRKKEWYRRK